MKEETVERAPGLSVPHNTAPASALVRLTPPDVRAVSVPTCDAFGGAVATSHPRFPTCLRSWRLPRFAYMF